MCITALFVPGHDHSPVAPSEFDRLILRYRLTHRPPLLRNPHCCSCCFYVAYITALTQSRHLTMPLSAPSGWNPSTKRIARFYTSILLHRITRMIAASNTAVIGAKRLKPFNYTYCQVLYEYTAVAPYNTHDSTSPGTTFGVNFSKTQAGSQNANGRCGNIINENTLQLWDRIFRRNSCLQAVCDTPIARITSCVSSLRI